MKNNKILSSVVCTLVVACMTGCRGTNKVAETVITTTIATTSTTNIETTSEVITEVTEDDSAIVITALPTETITVSEDDGAVVITALPTETNTVSEVEFESSELLPNGKPKYIYEKDSEPIDLEGIRTLTLSDGSYLDIVESECVMRQYLYDLEDSSKDIRDKVIGFADYDYQEALSKLEGVVTAVQAISCEGENDNALALVETTNKLGVYFAQKGDFEEISIFDKVDSYALVPIRDKVYIITVADGVLNVYVFNEEYRLEPIEANFSIDGVNILYEGEAGAGSLINFGEDASDFNTKALNKYGPDARLLAFKDDRFEVYTWDNQVFVKIDNSYFYTLRYKNFESFDNVIFERVDDTLQFTNNNVKYYITFDEDFNIIIDIL